MRLRAKVALVVGFIAGVHLIGLHSAFLAFTVLGVAVLLPIILKIDSWATQRRERARLSVDADAQHAAFMRGNDLIGIYGRYPVQQYREQIGLPAIELNYGPKPAPPVAPTTAADEPPPDRSWIEFSTGLRQR